MGRWIKRGFGALTLLAALAAFAGLPSFVPADVSGAMNWAISADVWLVNHAAFPGLFMLFMAIGVGVLFPDVWRAIFSVYLFATGGSRAETPQIKVFLEDDGVLQVPNVDGSLSRWVQFTVTPGNSVGLVSCEARLISVTNTASDDQLGELVEEHIRCGWSNLPPEPLDIHAGIKQRANLFAVGETQPNQLFPQTSPVKMRLLHGVQSAGDYRVKVIVTARGAKSCPATFLLHWGGNFDDLSITREA